MARALLLIDIQHDFLPGGALAVAEGDQVIPVANRIQPQFDWVVATQDWHPADHGSFAANHVGKQPGEMIDLDGLPQVLWPVHCVQATQGAAFAADLDVDRVAQVFHKGTDPTIDSYSGFYDNGHRKATGLEAYLKGKGIDEVGIVGLATDYCVKFSALDAVAAGFKTFVVTDGVRGVNLALDDSEKALAEMAAAGITLVTSEQI